MVAPADTRFYHVDGAENLTGPYSRADLILHLECSSLSREGFVAEEGSESWISADQFLSEQAPAAQTDTPISDVVSQASKQSRSNKLVITAVVSALIAVAGTVWGVLAILPGDSGPASGETRGSSPVLGEKAQFHPLAEWYLVGYEQGKTFRRSREAFFLPKNSEPMHLVQILQGIGVERAELRSDVFEVCHQGFEDGVNDEAEAYRLSDDQRGDGLPKPLIRVLFPDREDEINPLTTLDSGSGGDVFSTEQLFENAVPAFVTVKVSGKAGSGHGSGFYVAPGGYVLTNRHVIEDADVVEVLDADGKTHPATVLDSSEEPDLALLKIDVDEHPTMVFADGGEIKTGARIFILGKPLFADEDVNLNIGIISRSVTVQEVEHFQIDATINKGNSGGPVLDSSGKVVGVATWKLLGGERFNFAINSNECLAILKKNRVEGFQHAAE